MYTSMNDVDSIPFFSPPLEYNTTGLVDKDSAVLMDNSHCALPKDGPNIKKSVVGTKRAPPK